MQETDLRTWSFDVGDGFPLDAPHRAKSQVYDEHDVEYRHLRAKLIEGLNQTYYVVVQEVYDA